MGRPSSIRSTYKSFPPESASSRDADILDEGLTLGDLWTPLVVLARDRLLENTSFLQEWCDLRGIELMPHGKTTMAPSLWHLQMDTGAAGITVATPWQLRVAEESGIPFIQLANQLTDPKAIRWLVERLREGEDKSKPPVRVLVWIDDVRAVELVEEALVGFEPDASRIEVLVDMGMPGKRTGARSFEQAVEVAKRVAESPRLRLAGIAGYEGALVPGRSEESVGTIREFLGQMLNLHDKITPLYDEGQVFISAGGSAFPEVVGEVFAHSKNKGGRREARYVLRSGAYIIHDDGFYKKISPFSEDGLKPAARALTRVVSQPEPGLALLDGGKRDFAFDEGLPVPIAVQRTGQSLEGAQITAVNDQHSFLKFPEDISLCPGDLIVLGLSHPCTIFDKWRHIPVVDHFNEGIPELSAPIVEAIDTYF